MIGPCLYGVSRRKTLVNEWLSRGHDPETEISRPDCASSYPEIDFIPFPYCESYAHTENRPVGLRLSQFGSDCPCDLTQGGRALPETQPRRTLSGATNPRARRADIERCRTPFPGKRLSLHALSCLSRTRPVGGQSNPYLQRPAAAARLEDCFVLSCIQWKKGGPIARAALQITGWNVEA